MSDFHAIGGVSATLQTLLLDRMELPDGVPSVPVTIGPPPFTSKDNDPHKEDPRVNLFLYRVTENGYLQNQDIPGRSSPAALGHPPLSLSLHYLVTAYGNSEVRVDATTLFNETNAQFLLGSAMRVLHDMPIVTEALRTSRPPSNAIVLHESLRDEYEQVKLTLEPLTLEDVTKVWTALALRYRLSAAYVVNVVQIESRRPRRFPRPVGQPASSSTPPLPTAAPAPGPMVYVLTIQTPTITDVRVRRPPDPAELPFPYARVTDTLVLRGTSLHGVATALVIGDLRIPAALATGDRVEVSLPDATLPDGTVIPTEQRLQPGVRVARVVISDPRVPQSAAASNDAVFMLVPGVTPASVVYAAGPPRSLAFSGTRLIPAGPGGETVIGRGVVTRDQYLAASDTALTVPIPDTLPARDVHVLVSSPLPDPVPIVGGQVFDLTIGGTTRSITAHLTSPVPRDALTGILRSLIHDAGAPPLAVPPDPSFTGARVEMRNNRLYIVPGGLTRPITIASPAGNTIANDLKLTAAPPAGASSALLSGELGSPPPLSAVQPRLSMKVGAQPPVTLAIPAPLSLDALATSLQGAIAGASALPEYALATVLQSGSQLLVIPGAAGLVRFDPAPGDDTTAAELQLHARYAVRVRVNGAESLDPAVLELPQ